LLLHDKPLYLMKKYAIFIILLFLIPNVYSLISGHESFPFTPAPMFTHYVEKNSHFYEFQFIGKKDAAEVKLKAFHKHNTGFLSQNRFFFDQVYGSVEQNYPIGTVKQDGKKEFEQRVAKFFNVYFDYPEAKKMEQIKLVVNEYDNSFKLTDAHVVGIYDNQTKQFNHIWGSQQ
jgi:hypothetical protein